MVTNTTRTPKKTYREKGTGSGNLSVAGGEMPDVGAGGFTSDEELYAEKARKQFETNLAAKQLGFKGNAARFRPGSANE